jgi:hypothetical protein
MAGLRAGSTYDCRLTASVAGTVVATSAGFAAVVAAADPAAADPGSGAEAGTGGRAFAFTGAGPEGITALAAVLLALGAVAVLAARRRRRGT